MPGGGRVFGEDDQRAFAAISGDRNPMHLDPLAARRLLFGAAVVHGIHGALWALDETVPAGTHALTEVELSFRQPVRVGDRCHLTGTTIDAGRADVGITAEGRDASRIRARWVAADQPQPAAPALPPRPSPGPCVARDLDDLLGAAGEVELAWDADAGEALFPRLTASLPPWQLAVLLATTRIVGMECPGERSLYSSLRLRFTAPAGSRSLAWRVTKVDARLSLVHLALAADGVEGEIVAFVRPAPTRQPSTAELGALVEPGEFAGSRVLVVGGSRGLGEITAKMAAAGGADVRLTWHRGQADASAVCDDIRAAGGHAEAFAYDVTDPAADLALDGWQPTLLAWFATPFISLSETSRFVSDQFHHYCRFFVDGFVHAIDLLAPGPARPLVVLYPSTAALDEVLPKAMEYAAAKAAGEAVCQHLAKRHEGLHVIAPRLPRLPTDQTASLLPVAAADPAATMLPLLRQAHAALGAAC